jgi:hypothetical protein
MNPLIAPKTAPTMLERAEIEERLATGCKGFHESLLRSYQVLSLVKDLLAKRVDHEVILQIIQLNYDEQS